MLLRVAEALVWSAVTLLVFTANLPSEGRLPSSTLSAGLDVPRDFQVGDWMQVLVEDEATGISVQGTVVIASNDGREVLFGFDSEAIHPLFLNYGLFPTTGATLPNFAHEVSEGNRRYDLGRVPGRETFQPLQFPLRTGEAWTSFFKGVDIRAEVVDASGSEAHIIYESLAENPLGYEQRPIAEGTYDATLGWFSKFTFRSTSFPVVATVTNSGNNYGCESLRPEALGTYDRSDGFRNRSGNTGIVSHFTVPPDTTHISLSVTITPGLAPTSVFLTSPQGTLYHASAMPGTGVKNDVFVSTNPAGTWWSVTEVNEGSFARVTAAFFAAKTVPPFGSPTSDPSQCTMNPATHAALPVEEQGHLEFAWRILVIAALAAVRLRHHLFWGTIGLFSRLTPAEVADQPVRRRMLELIGTQDSLTTQEIRTALGIGWGAAVHHLSVLERAGRITRSNSGRRVYWTLPGSASVPRLHGKAAAMLREILAEPGLGPSQLAKRLHVQHSTVIYHANRLADQGRIRVESEGHRRRYFPTGKDALRNSAKSGESPL